MSFLTLASGSFCCSRARDVHLALRIGANIWEGLTGFGDEEAGRAVEGDGWDAGWELGRGNGSHAAWGDGDGAFGADVVHVGHDEGPEGIEELHFSYWDSESVMTLRMEKKGKDEGIAHYMGVNAVGVLDQAIWSQRAIWRFLDGSEVEVW